MQLAKLKIFVPHPHMQDVGCASCGLLVIRRQKQQCFMCPPQAVTLGLMTDEAHGKIEDFSLGYLMWHTALVRVLISSKLTQGSRNPEEQVNLPTLAMHRGTEGRVRAELG